MKDVLDQAIAALRAETTGASEEAPATRRRVLLAAQAARRRNLTRLRLVVPLAAVLVLSTAWAAMTGRIGRWVDALSPDTAGHPTSTSAAPGSAASASAPASASASASASAPASASASASASAPASASRLAPGSGASAAAPALDAEEALYRAAHEAHFVRHDPSAAVAAWDRYLAAYPRGRFAPEARYNRAITLIRLGRTDDARAALHAFADAPPGSYRREEARKLLEALE